MNTNTQTSNTGQIDDLVLNLQSGLDQWAATLKLTQVTSAELGTQLAAFLPVDADYNAERTARQVLSTAVQTAQGALANWLAAVKTTLASSLGQRWSSAWIAVGFLTPSLEIPRAAARQLTLGISMVAFLTKNSSYEAAKPKVTALYGQSLLKAVTDTKKTLKDGEAAFNALSLQWDAVYGTLSGTIGQLIGILKHSLGALDPRWLDFGLPMPGTPSTPGKPVGLVAQLNGDGSIGVACPAVPLATRYRWRMRFVGVQVDYTLAARSVDPMASIKGVLPGQTVELLVQAVNGGLQSVASEPIVFTVPLIVPTAKPASAEATAVVAETPGLSNATTGYRNGTNGHQNGNGHARG